MLTSWMSLENWHICWYGSATHQIQASSMPKVLFLSLSLYLCVYSNVYAVLFLLHCRLSLSGVHCFSFTHSLVCSFVHFMVGLGKTKIETVTTAFMYVSECVYRVLFGKVYPNGISFIRLALAANV